MARKEHDEWFWKLSDDFDRLTEEMVRGIFSPTLSTRRFWEPRVDVCESNDAILVKAELAGIDPQALHVTLAADQRSLFIRGNRSDSGSEGEPNTSCYQLEIYYGDFERRVSLPDIPIDRNNIKAAYRNGMLIITVPKLSAEAVEATRRIIPVVEES